MSVEDIQVTLTKPVPLTSHYFTLNISALSFWVLFVLNYLYLTRLLIVITQERFRLGAFVLALSVLIIILSGKLVKNICLAIAITLLVIVSIISAVINHIPWEQFLAFVRIPIVIYLVYDLVWRFLKKKENVYRVLHFLTFIGIFQLPILVIQRLTYSRLPEWFIYTTTLVDFGMGTFNGDTTMAFTLVGLIILLLFDEKYNQTIKHKWLIAVWFTLTIFISNSQIQQATVSIVWFFYLIFRLRFKELGFVFVSLITLVVLSLMIVRSSVLITYAPSLNTISKISKLEEVITGDVDYTSFLNGGTARTEALSYYLNHPIKWLGNGPGSAYDTATGKRTIGGWGHVFTFYAEVGLLGLALSMFVFFIIAFPIRVLRSAITIRFSWVQLLMFLSIIMVTIVKYPMGDTSISFTYCVLLIGHHVLSTKKKEKPLHE